MGLDSIVGIVTRCRLDGPGIESWWGDIFCTGPDWPCGPPSLLYNGYRFCPEGKVAGVWRWPPTQSSAKVEGGVELHISSLSGPMWPVLGWALPLYLYCWPFRCDIEGLHNILYQWNEVWHSISYMWSSLWTDYGVFIWLLSVCQAVNMSASDWDIAFMNSIFSDLFPLAKWPSVMDESLLRLTDLLVYLF